MKKLLFIMVTMTSLFLSTIGFSQNNTSEEETLVVDDNAGHDTSLWGDIESVVYVPREWGDLKAVTAHGAIDILYFQASDGSIYVIQGKPGEYGQYWFPRHQGGNKDITQIGII